MVICSTLGDKNCEKSICETNFCFLCKKVAKWDFFFDFHAPWLCCQIKTNHKTDHCSHFPKSSIFLKINFFFVNSHLSQNSHFHHNSHFPQNSHFIQSSHFWVIIFVHGIPWTFSRHFYAPWLFVAKSKQAICCVAYLLFLLSPDHETVSKSVILSSS